MGRTPRKRTKDGGILIRLTAEEYNNALETIIKPRNTSFQEFMRNALLAPSNQKNMIGMLELILLEAKLPDKLKLKIQEFLRNLKGLR